MPKVFIYTSDPGPSLKKEIMVLSLILYVLYLIYQSCCSLQLLNMQKEIQKQISATVAVPVNKEGRRLETALGKSMEKALKANSDALWARFQEENTKQEKLLRERTQQILNLVTSSLTKDLPADLEKIVKKEVAAVGPVVAHTLTPTIEKTVLIAITEAFQVYLKT